MAAIHRSILTALILILLSGGAQAIDPSDWEVEQPWQFSIFGGVLTGDTFFDGLVNGEAVNAETDTGAIVGGRFGQEGEWLGWETSMAVAFADTDVSADPASGQAGDEDAIMLLGTVDGMWFFTGNEWADGRVRPFACAGPGFVYLDSGYGQADNETYLDLNIGGGIKFLLGDQGNPVLRVDYRWHYLTGPSSVNDMNLQEVSVGLGFRF